MAKRELWGSKVGFIWAAIGSAVGLGSIWRFPYVAGQNGGGAFVILFCLFLVLISLPVLIAEILIGRKVHLNPAGAYESLGKSRAWGAAGLVTVITGLLISSFYSVICSWTLGYLLEALGGTLTGLLTSAESAYYFSSLTGSPIWSLATHFGFMFIATAILYVGVQKGIESANRILMPLLFFLLVFLVFKGLSFPGSYQGIRFLFEPKWSDLSPQVALLALGQAFFGLSIGQGTMVTYGSYFSSKESIPSTAFPIALSVILVSLLAGVAIFTVVFSVGAEPSSGSSLMFETLPVVFNQVIGGYYLTVLFFLLIFLAGLTSQISAMEPVICYLIDKMRCSRHKAVFITAILSFFIGIPSALSFSVWKRPLFWHMNFFTLISNLSINILVPLGALAAVLLVGWKWGISSALEHLQEGSGNFYRQFSFVRGYLYFSVKFLIPIVIILILINLFGLI